MAAEEVKISSDAARVFTNGLNKEVKEKTTSNPTNSGFTTAEQSLKSALISMFLIRS
jgi:hypothetical protein